MALMALCIWIAFFAYIQGKKKGKPWRYLLASIPVSALAYLAAIKATVLVTA